MDLADTDIPKTDEQKAAAKNLDTLMLAQHSATDPEALEGIGTKIADTTKDLAGTANEVAAEAVAKNHDQIKKFMEQHINTAKTYLTDYLKVFAGEDAKGVDEKTMQIGYVPEKYAGPYKTKKHDKYQIPAMTDEEVRQYKIKLLKADTTTFNIERMYFKIAYTLDIGK